MWYKANKKIIHTGAMVALYPNQASGKRILIKNIGKNIGNAEPLENLHITLFYFPNPKKIDKPKRGLIWHAMSKMQDKFKNIDVKVSGLGLFRNKQDDGKHVCHALINSPELVKLRTDMARVLDMAEIEYSKDFVYTPHITMAYVKSAPKIDVQQFDVKLDSFSYCIDDNKIFEFKL